MRHGQQLSLTLAQSVACHVANLHGQCFFVEHVMSVLWVWECDKICRTEIGLT